MQVEYGFTPPKFSTTLRQRIGAPRMPPPQYRLSDIAAAGRAMCMISAKEFNIHQNLSAPHQEGK